MFHVVDPPRHGTLSGTNESLVYTPDSNYAGEDHFTFISDDGEADSTPATVAITVTPVNDAPVADPQELEMLANTALPIELTGSDPDGDALSFEIIQQPSHGALTGSGASLVYTPVSNYRGPDQFEFSVSDGQLTSPPAPVSINVIRPNRPPEIVSVPVEVGTEDDGYQYDVNAQDPDDDPLGYAIDRATDGLGIDPATGFFAGALDPELVQPVRAFNKQCFVIPEGAASEDGQGTVIAPLYQRVRRAISNASRYVAPQTLAWDRTNGCLGCHVQNQALIGLQASMDRADVDEQAAEYLLAKILGSVQSDGSIRLSHPEHARTQTAFALWALSYAPDRARTLAVRERGLQFFRARVQNSGVTSFWTQDHATGWANSAHGTTAVTASACWPTLRRPSARCREPACRSGRRTRTRSKRPIRTGTCSSTDWTALR
jgi:hypothetical protein